MNAFIYIAILLYVIVDFILQAALIVKEIKERESKREKRKRNKEEIERKRFNMKDAFFYTSC